MATRNVWDNPAVAPKESRYAKFSEVGTEYHGVITAVTTKTFDPDGPDEKTVPVIVLDTGTEITCSAIDLHEKVWKARPEIGDRISVQYVGDEGRRKVFAVLVNASAPAAKAAPSVAARRPVPEPDPWADLTPAEPPF